MNEQYETLDVEISDETMLSLLKLFMTRNNFSDASMYHFDKVLEEADGDYQIAIHAAVVNEMVLNALMELIEKGQTDVAAE